MYAIRSYYALDVVVSAEDFLASDELIVLMPPEGDLERELRLRRGGAVLVRVVDPTGAPIPRVRVRHRRPGEALDAPESRNRLV